jgi:hypothetical protein
LSLFSAQLVFPVTTKLSSLSSLSSFSLASIEPSPHRCFCSLRPDLPAQSVKLAPATESVLAQVQSSTAAARAKMEPAVTGALAAAGTAVQGAAQKATALWKGFNAPTAPVNATFSTIDSVRVPRAHHTVSLVKGRAYVFGGETSPGRNADNGMAMIILPSSSVHEADYTIIPARSVEKGGPIPAARKGHAAIVIGEEIFIYGGELVGSASHTDEEPTSPPPSAGIVEASEPDGTVWAFNTTTRSWRRILAPASSPAPPARTGHTAAASLEPHPKHVVTHTEVLPQTPADPATVVPEPAAAGSYGTLFIYGGRATAHSDPAHADVKGKGKAADTDSGLEPILYSDLWALDINSGVWSNLPPTPGGGREGAALTVIGHRAYTFGGCDASGALDTSGIVHCIDIGGVVRDRDAKVWSPMIGAEWEEVPFALPNPEANSASNIVPLPRHGASLLPITTWRGRTYALLVGGEDATGPANSVWALQLPTETPPASNTRTKDNRAKDKTPKKNSEAYWNEVVYRYIDKLGDELVMTEQEHHGEHGIGKRVAVAASEDDEVDGGTIVVWGGLDEKGRTRRDGVFISVDR